MRLIAPLILLAFLAACAPPNPQPVLGPDGQPLPRVYRINPRDADEIQFRMLDAVNTLRQASGAAVLTLSPELTAAAATHSRDMSLQNRSWHFGSDGSSPLDRVRRTGYPGRFVGENISETYENETQTLTAWMENPVWRTVILDPRARQMGFSWYQEESGKIWWTLVMGD